ncbi:MAG: radical SAM protein, partial [bacterium]
MNTAEVLLRYPLYAGFRRLRFPVLTPLSIACCVTHRCNSRCMTCRIYEDPAEEMDARTWDAALRSIPRGVLWMTVTGGEPFMREDAADLIFSMASRCEPRFLTVVTNGYFT